MSAARTRSRWRTCGRSSGFVEVEVRQREPMGVADCALYPLFTRELLDLMRRLPPERQDAVGVAVVIRAQLPA